VRLSGATDFRIDGNTLRGANSSYQNNFGIIVDNGGSSTSNIVQANTLTNLETGILTMGVNAANNQGGLQLRCNIFQPAMRYQLSVSGTLADQGSSCSFSNTAENQFFTQTLPAGSQINAPGVKFSYFGSGTIPTNIVGPVTVTTCAGVVGACYTGMPLALPVPNSH
jgi:hypothetical protein